MPPGGSGADENAEDAQPDRARGEGVREFMGHDR